MNWKRNQDIVVTTDLFAANALRLERERYKKWAKFDNMERWYILVLMSSILQHQLKDYLSATDMILSLKEMFGE